MLLLGFFYFSFCLPFFIIILFRPSSLYYIQINSNLQLLWCVAAFNLNNAFLFCLFISSSFLLVSFKGIDYWRFNFESQSKWFSNEQQFTFISWLIAIAYKGHTRNSNIFFSSSFFQNCICIKSSFGLCRSFGLHIYPNWLGMSKYRKRDREKQRTNKSEEKNMDYYRVQGNEYNARIPKSFFPLFQCISVLLLTIIRYTQLWTLTHGFSLYFVSFFSFVRSFVCSRIRIPFIIIGWINNWTRLWILSYYFSRLLWFLNSCCTRSCNEWQVFWQRQR